MNINEIKFQDFLSAYSFLKRRGLKDKEIAKKLDVSPGYLTKIKAKERYVSDNFIGKIIKLIEYYKEPEVKDIVEEDKVNYYQLGKSQNAEKLNYYKIEELQNKLDDLEINHKKEMDELKKKCAEEVNALREIIGHQKFLLSEYKRIQSE